MRHARLWGSFFTGITDYSFEIDDDGNPYWVVTTYKNNWGFSLPEADGILLIDAQTGETKRYGMDEIPSWIDRVQPEDFVINQIDNKGEYIHGVFNFLITRNSVLQREISLYIIMGAVTCLLALPVSVRMRVLSVFIWLIWLPKSQLCIK